MPARPLARNTGIHLASLQFYSILTAWHTNAHAFHLFADLYLAGKSAGIVHIKRKLQHALFQLIGRVADRLPFVRYVDVTGTTGTESAAVSLNARNQVIDRALHDGGANWNLYLMLRTVYLNIDDLRH